MNAYCETGTKTSNVTALTSGFKSGSVIRGRPLTAVTHISAQVTPCGICGGQRDTVTGFSPSISAVHPQYQPTNALYSSLCSKLLLTEGQTHKACKP